MWGGGGQRQRPPSSPLAVHRAADFDGHPGAAAGDPNVSISRFDGRPLGPARGAHAGAGSPRRHAADHHDLSRSRFDGRPLTGPPAGVPPRSTRSFHTSVEAGAIKPHAHHDDHWDFLGTGYSFFDDIRLLWYGKPSHLPPHPPTPLHDVGHGPLPVHPAADHAWAYTGERHSAYEPITEDYHYSGEAAVLRQPVSAIPHWRLRKCWLLLGGILVVVLVIILLHGLMDGGKGAMITFNCAEGYEKGWSVAKLQFCCQTIGIGCDGSSAGRESLIKPAIVGVVTSTETITTTSSTLTTEIYNCDDGWDENKVPLWEPGKMAWCCLNHDRGCPVTTTELPFFCEADLENWEVTWSYSKKMWCCDHEYVACPPGHVPPQRPAVGPDQIVEYDCSMTRDDWWAAWSAPKKAWCCQWEQVGCPTFAPTTTTETKTTTPGWNCMDDYESWEVTWSEKRKEHCCATVGRGCALPTIRPSPPPPPPVPYDCAAGYANWEAGWDTLKKVWCCQFTGKGCPANTCDAVCSLRGEDSSCKARVQWLVSNRGATCTASLAQVAQECAVCSGCSLAKTGCLQPASGTTTTASPVPSVIPYDCAADFAAWQTSWTAAKKVWCCLKVGKGCDPSLTDVLSYDCDAGFENWAQGWALAKKGWCCMHVGKGCPQGDPQPVPFDCDLDFNAWEAKWPAGKKAWCCQRTGRACPPQAKP